MSANFTPNQNNYKNLTPFKEWLMLQINTWGQVSFPFVESDFDELTNYGMMQKLMNALNDVIANENKVEQDVTNLFNAFTELQSYVNNYFDNLDVQDEINNKLDNMASTGQLTNLIKGYVDPIYQAYEDNINAIIYSQNNRITSIDNKVNSSMSAAPKGVYATEAALIAANPSHDYVYLVSENGYWYYYDTTLNAWTSGGLYQASENSDSVNYLLNFAITKYNKELMDYSTIAENKIISNNTGLLEDNSSYNTSDYIFLQGNKSYTITGTIRKYILFDTNKNAIAASFVSTQTTNPVINTTNDCYLKISFTKIQTFIKVNLTSNVNSSYKLYNDEINGNIDLNEYQLNQIDKQFYLSKMLDVFNINYNIIEPEWVENKYINTFIEEESNNNTKYFSYTIDSSNINNIYKIQGTSYGGVKCYIFVDSNNIISDFTPTSNTTEEVDYIFIPNKTGTLYINSYSAFDDTTLSVLNNLTLDNIKNDILTNKKYTACGDSFTEGDFTYSDENYQFDSGVYTGENKVYPYIIGDRCSMNIINLARGGMTLTNVRPTNSFTAQEIYKNIPSDTDYITLKFGINDGHQGAPIGNINDSGITSFYGAWNTCLSYIIEHYPNARIGIIVSNGLDTIDYANATINIAKKYGLPYLNEATGENEPLLLRSLRTDVSGTIKTLRNNNFKVAPNALFPNNSNNHPNVKCHYLESEMVEAFLRRI